MERALIYALIFLAGFAAVSIIAFAIIIRPPGIEISGTPSTYHLPAEDVTIVTADGLKLAAWFIPREDGRRDAPAILLLHGYPAEKSDMLPLASRLYKHFPILLLDLRSFGDSEGAYTTLGVRERDDVKRAVRFLKEEGAPAVGVFGFSLGGAVGLTTAAEDSRVRAVAAYAPFSDLRTLGYESYARLWLLKYPLVELMLFWADLLFGGSAREPSPISAAGTLSIPVFLAASREDEQIPFSHAERLRAALAKNPAAEFYFFDQGRHGELPSDFESRLIRFFSAALESPN